MTNNKLKIQQMQADIAQMQLEDVRDEVIATEEPDWLSEPNKYMVSLTLTGSTPHGASVGVYRWAQMQSSGTLSNADLITLRDYLTGVIGDEK